MVVDLSNYVSIEAMSSSDNSLLVAGRCRWGSIYLNKIYLPSLERVTYPLQALEGNVEIISINELPMKKGDNQPITPDH